MGSIALAGDSLPSTSVLCNNEIAAAPRIKSPIMNTPAVTTPNDSRRHGDLFGRAGSSRVPISARTAIAAFSVVVASTCRYAAAR
jgi:hypothetical protein